MTEMLQYPFMQSAIWLGIVLGVLFSLMGVFIVTRGMAFFSDFVAHASILGGAMALMIDIDPVFFLVPYGLAVAFAASAVWNRLNISRDTVLSVFYGGAVAAGLILISVKGLSHQSLMQILFGDILLVGKTDIWMALGLLFIFAAFLAFSMRRLIKCSFMPEIATAEGINVKLYDYALIGLIAVTISLSIKLTGVVLANSMVVIPAAAAKAISRSFRQFLFIAPMIGVATFLTGETVSFYYDIPTGPAVIAAAFVVFLITMAIGKIRGGG